MKQILFFFILAVGITFGQSAFTQNTKITQGTDGITVYIAGTIDTANTLNSNSFKLLGYDKVDLYTYPLNAGVLLSGTSTATRKVHIFIQGSHDNSNWSNIDTISNADSANTILAKTALNLNTYRMPFYRLSVVGATSANNDTGFKVWLYGYRKD